MRKLKFRAWDTQKHEWVDFRKTTGLDDAEPYTEFRLVTLNGRLAWCQYTGLTDKNGKEIYEGDILELLEPNWLGKAEVLFEDARFLVLTRQSKAKSLYETMPEECSEVIGNIYENPELLEDDDA